MEDLKKNSTSTNKQFNIDNNNQIDNQKFSSDYLKNNIEYKRNILIMFEKLLNNKNKFSLNNNFDKKHCQKFLIEKDKYLSEIIFEEEPLLTEEKIEINNSKRNFDIHIPSSPNKFSFGQM